jgi:Domain of unknown function (DUF6134)
MSVSRSGIVRTTVAMLGVAVGVMGCIAAPARAASPSALTEQLRYKVEHSVFGDIGTYTNDVRTVGDLTTVKTTAHFLVKLLGIGMHREDAERTERWRGSRLVSFFGVTTKNDRTTEVIGKARGDEFVINSSLGTFTAPATVQPANPWSAACLNSTTMMRVDNGKIEQVRVTGGGESNVVIDGATVPTRVYEIDGGTRYKIWFDQRNIPVMFAVDDDSGKVTFTLEK